LLNVAILDDLHELIRENPSLFLDEIDEWLAIYHDQPISTTTIHDNLRDLGLRLKVGTSVSTSRSDDLIGMLLELFRWSGRHR
ncbi:hypothetical protein SCLCIDRAFT_129613, partial [Scleroderma citrinum Foug A]